MECDADRVVRRVQRRMQSASPIGRSRRPNPRDVVELEARVRRLHAMGERFSHVRLSPHVARFDATGVVDRVGGECVAREV